MAIKIVKTKTIKAKYAAVPNGTLTMDFMVEMLEPIPMIPSILTVSHMGMVINSKTPEEALKEAILADWRSRIEMYDVNAKEETKWLSEVDSVELIECDLMVPRKTKILVKSDALSPNDVDEMVKKYSLYGQLVLV